MIAEIAFSDGMKFDTNLKGSRHLSDPILVAQNVQLAG